MNTSYEKAYSYKLVFVGGPCKGQQVEVVEPKLLIGRHPGCTLQLKGDVEVAHKHAELSVNGRGLTIRALDPFYGTLVNRKYVQTCCLSHGDVIRCGHSHFQVRASSQNAVLPTRRKSRFHGLAVAAVVSILFLQLLFLVRLFYWHSDGDSSFQKAKPSTDLALERATEKAQPQMPEAQLTKLDQAVVSTSVSSKWAPKFSSLSVTHGESLRGAMFDEVRVVRIEFRPQTDHNHLNMADVEMTVTFYDEEEDSGNVVVSQAVAPQEALPITVQGDEEPTYHVAATYMVPKGFRDKEALEQGGRRRFLGYAVRLFYRNELQEEFVAPSFMLDSV